MAGRRHKEKGNRVERKLVGLLEEAGLSAQRIPLSGSAGGEFAGDLHVTLPLKWPVKMTAEVKARRNAEGWKQVLDWLGDNELLFLVKDRAEPTVVMPWETFAWLIDTLVTHSNLYMSNPHFTARMPDLSDEEE